MVGGLVKPKESKQTPCSTQMKKKCVNGFIMFCRMNRKQYIRWEGILFSPDWGPTPLSIHPQSMPPTAADTFLSHALPASPWPRGTGQGLCTASSETQLRLRKDRKLTGLN